MAKLTLRDLKRRGFDRSIRERDGWYRVRCSQCAATCICGVPCHERGCPNAPQPEPKEDF